MIAAPQPTRLQAFGENLLVGIGAGGLTLLCFLVLPLLKEISKRPEADLMVRDVDTAALPPPPPPPIEEEKPPTEQEPPKAPEIPEDAPPLDLSQLELALGGGIGDGALGGDFVIKLDALGGGDSAGGDEMFSLADLDQQPRPVYRQPPNVNAAMKKRIKKGEVTVNLLFTVDPSGRVESPIVQTPVDPDFDSAALAAIKQWKFEPGKRGGQPVRFRMRLPMTFQ